MLHGPPRDKTIQVKFRDCSKCHGRGYIGLRQVPTEYGMAQEKVRCKRCNGTGRRGS